MDNWKKQLLELSEKIGKTMISVNKALSEFMRTDTFKNLVDFFSNLPDDIQDTELFHHITQLEKSEITYAEIEWIQELFGYTSFDMNVQTLHEEPVLNPFEYEENTSAEPVFDSGRGVLYPHCSIKTNRNSVAVSSLYLLRYLCNMIQSRIRFEEKQKVQRTDRKLQQKINDKKRDQGLKM